MIFAVAGELCIPNSIAQLVCVCTQLRQVKCSYTDSLWGQWSLKTLRQWMYAFVGCAASTSYIIHSNSHTLAQRHTYLYTTIDFDMATTNTGKWQMMAIMHRFALIKNHRARKRTAEMRRVSADESSQRCDDAVIFYGPLQRTCITGMWYVCVCVETSVTKDNHAMMPLEHKCVYTMLWYNFGVVLPMTRTP